jgi:hypothetical protein
MSRKTRTTPATSPLSLRIGAALSLIARSVPSRATSTLWLANLTVRPSRKARTVGLSTGWRLSSLTMRNTPSSGCPTASSGVHPVSDWATGFRKVTRPAVSVVMTASPMLESVTSSQSRCSCIASKFAGEGSVIPVLRLI